MAERCLIGGDGCHNGSSCLNDFLDGPCYAGWHHTADATPPGRFFPVPTRPAFSAQQPLAMRPIAPMACDPSMTAQPEYLVTH